MNYIRICKGVHDKGRMVSTTDDIYKGVDLTKDYYTSAFMYNDKHYQIFKDTGTVTGITDTITKKLYWDFDSVEDLNLAKADATELCNRLINKHAFKPTEVSLFFSGKKGFQVEVNYKDTTFTPSEVRNVCLNLGEGLLTLDRQIYNASRILRLPLSKHDKSGLYKIPLDPTDLSNLSIEDIREEAKNAFPVEDLVGAYDLVTAPTLGILILKKETPKIEEKTLNSVVYDLKDIDWNSKPKFLTPEKYLLSLGFFGEGERSHALMILGSTFKALGYNETQTYHFLKATAEIQAERTGLDKIDKKDIHDKIIKQIYKDGWRGGQYAVNNDDLLQRLSLLVPKEVRSINDQEEAVSVKQGFARFKEYAKNIAKNTISTGIKVLDKLIRLQTGRLYAILGSPGAGKTSMTTIFLNNTSKLGDPNIIFSYDMSGPDFIQKLIQRHTSFNAEKIYEMLENDYEKTEKLFEKILQENYSNTTFVFKTGQTLHDMKQTILEKEKELGVSFRLVIVDYLELIQSRFSDPTQASMESIQGLREIAVGMNKAVIVLLQPSKAGGNIDEPMMSYHAAKGSSSIAQACTAMLTIHRPGCNSRTPEYDKFFGIDCVKNRAGPLFSLDLHWDGLTGNIRELDELEEAELRDLRERKKELKNAANNSSLF